MLTEFQQHRSYQYFLMLSWLFLKQALLQLKHPLLLSAMSHVTVNFIQNLKESKSKPWYILQCYLIIITNTKNPSKITFKQW